MVLSYDINYSMGSEFFAVLFNFYFILYSPPMPGLCPPDMVYIPAGMMYIGSNIDNESPIRRSEKEAYCIDAYEYPNIKGEYAKANLNWKEAEEHCEEVGKRLCTETEWEKACRGPKNDWYTYGRRYLKDMCNIETPKRRVVLPSGHFPKCKSAYGVYDMSGGLLEWTADPYAPYPGNVKMRPSRFSFWEKSVRSAGYSKGRDSYCSNRKGLKWNQQGGYLGFRCCTSFDEMENQTIKDGIWDVLSKY